LTTRRVRVAAGDEDERLANVFDHCDVGFLKSEGFSDKTFAVRMDIESSIACARRT